ncbi:MAG: LamG domain-containing protein [Nanoarchaeota archaeon]
MKKYLFMKKAISPVVATALLLVVAVVAVVGFQNWFGSFSSEIFSDVEQQSSNSIQNDDIKAIIDDEIYFVNGESKNISIKEIKIGDKVCNLSNLNVGSGMNNLSLSNCTQNITTGFQNVVVVTEDEIISRKLYVKELYVPPPGPCDPHWDNVVLYMEMENFTDLSTRGHTITQGGDPTLSSNDPRYGDYSLLLDGSGDYLTMASTSELSDWNNVNFTVEYSFKLNSFANLTASLSINSAPTILGNMQHDSFNVRWSFGPYDATQLKIYYYFGTGSENLYYPLSENLNTGVWYDFAFVHDETTDNVSLYLDGNLIGSSILTRDLDLGSDPITIGALNNNYYNGYIDNVRITRAKRYDGNYNVGDETNFISKSCP